MDEKITKEKVIEIIKEYNKSAAFTDRKLTDTPTDALSVVNKKFVTQNGNTASRPSSPVVGLQYFDTSLGYPIYYNGSIWVKSDGTAA